MFSCHVFNLVRLGCACLWVWWLQALDRKCQSSIKVAAEEVQATVSGISGSWISDPLAIHSQLACDLACEKVSSQDVGLREDLPALHCNSSKRFASLLPLLPSCVGYGHPAHADLATYMLEVRRPAQDQGNQRVIVEPLAVL